MNTKKKSKIKFTAFISIFILSVTYFSLLSPTSAFFHKADKVENNITFALFDVSQTVLQMEEKIKFKAATKFEDFDELLFDDVAVIKDITLTNNGEADARIYTDITPTEDSETNGLKYIVLKKSAPVEGETETTTVSSVVTKGETKQEIESVLNQHNSSFVSDISESEAVSILNSYNENTNPGYILLEAGQSVDLSIVFWAEYGNIKDTLEDTANVKEIPYLCDILITATQNTDGITF